MHRSLPVLALAFAAIIGTYRTGRAQGPEDWAGTWFSSRGVIELRAGDGDRVTGAVRGDAKSSLDGEVDRDTLRVRWSTENGRGGASWRMHGGRHFFEGTYQAADGSRGVWHGWREDRAAAKGRTAKWGGAWRTSRGIVTFVQKGDAVEGLLGAQGWYEVGGEAQGRHLELQQRSPFGSGRLWLQQVDADRAFGAIDFGGEPTAFVAQRMEFDEPAKPKAGAIVSGLSSNRLSYHLRMPKRWRAGQSLPLVVILHGSNMASLPYVQNLGGRIGERFAIVGIDGERWVDRSSADDPRHNYSYVNYMGRSTYSGYPHTDRESPALVADLIRELKEELGSSKVFVGGHSQGGFLSWFFAMHEPELVDGIFPIAAGLVMQCEPDVFEDEALREAQRQVAIAVVHGRRDQAVAFSQGLDAFRSFEEHRFPMLRMFDNDAPHSFSALRWPDAIDWLAAITADDPDALLDFAERRLDEDGFRDATAAILRARRLHGGTATTRRAAQLMARVDEYAAADAQRFADAFRAAADGEVAEGGRSELIDDFLAFRAQFEFADAAGPAVLAFAELRARHEPEARKLFDAARAAFHANDRAGGYAQYERIVATCWASSLYRRVRGWLDAR